MKKLLFSIMALLAVAGTSMAQNALSVADITLPQNGEATLTVSFQLDAADTYTSYSFNLELPSDLEFVMESGTDVAYTKGNCYDATHSVTANLSDGVVKVACLSISSKTLTSTEGTLLTFTVRPTKTIAVGQTLTGTISDILIVPVEGLKQNLASSSFTITISEPEETRTILDETSEDAPEAAENVNVRVKRTIKANEWSTICLPFAMTAAQIESAFGSDVTVELGDADSYETTEDDQENIVGIKIKFNTVTAIEANHPYIIRVSKAVRSFDVDGVDVNAATRERDRRKALVNSKSYFVGNYENQTEVPEFCLFLSGNRFWYSIGETKMKGFRGYFKLNDVLTEVEEADARIGFSFEEATGISDNQQRMDTDGHGVVYDLQGRRIDQPVKKGLYIRNGKKEIVK